MAHPPKQVLLKPQTLEAFETYIRSAEAEAVQALRMDAPFLWSDMDPDRARPIRAGQILAQFWAGRGPVKVPSGLIHDWVAAVLFADKTVDEVLALIQDYDHHENIYQPEVMASKLVSRHGNDFQVYLRLLKKKVITVVLDTEHEVHYSSVDPSRWMCRSYTTSIAEVEDAGSPKEKILPPDTGYGFLWRLYSYWRFEEREDGVCVECRAISLTRDVPFGLGWVIEPITQKLPQESLIKTLEDTRNALQTKVP
jgi:hypothetical protein